MFMSDTEDRFVKAAKEAYRRTIKDGARSTERIKALHGWVQKEITLRLGNEYEIRGLSDDPDSGEEKVSGYYYEKSVDVSVSRNDKVLGVVSCKFVNSNYKQNANNYFESQIGETANLRRNNIVFGNIFCVTEPIPYKKKSGRIGKLEHIREIDIEKYHKLENDHTHLYAPNVQAMVVVKTDMGENAITKTWKAAAKKTTIDRIATREDLHFLCDEVYTKLQSMGFERFFRIFANSIKNIYDKSR